MLSNSSSALSDHSGLESIPLLRAVGFLERPVRKKRSGGHWSNPSPSSHDVWRSEIETPRGVSHTFSPVKSECAFYRLVFIVIIYISK